MGGVSIYITYISVSNNYENCDCIYSIMTYGGVIIDTVYQQVAIYDCSFIEII